MKVVSNTTPLIALSRLERLGLLQQLFGHVVIAQAVFEEVVAVDRVGAASVRAADWIRPAQVQDALAVEVLLDELDWGEAETIVLAREWKADLVLMDERKGRRKLSQLRLRKSGTVGILLRAKEKGILDRIEPEIARLQKRGFYLSNRVVEEVLRKAGESSTV